MGFALFIAGASMPSDALLAERGGEMITTRTIVIGFATLWMVLTHVNWPHRLTTQRAKIYLTPLKHQWLLDFAGKDCANPTSRMRTLEQHVKLDGLDADEPYISIRVVILNGSIYGINFEQEVTGSLIRDGHGLASRIELASGRGKWVSGHEGHVQLTHFVPKTTADDLRALDPETEAIDWFPLSGIRLGVLADCEGAKPVQYSLGGNRRLIVERP